MVAGQNLRLVHFLTSSPEAQQLLFQQMKQDNQQLKEDLAILKEQQKAKLEIKQNLHSLTSSPEFVHQLFQQLKEENQQLKEDIAIRKEQQKAKLEIKPLNAHIAILEGKLHLQHRNTPSCPLPSDSASLSQPNLETTAVSWQPVSPEARLVHFLTSSPEFQQLPFQQLQEGHRQLIGN